MVHPDGLLEKYQASDFMDSLSGCWRRALQRRDLMIVDVMSLQICRVMERIAQRMGRIHLKDENYEPGLIMSNFFDIISLISRI